MKDDVPPCRNGCVRDLIFLPLQEIVAEVPAGYVDSVGRAVVQLDGVIIRGVGVAHQFVDDDIAKR